MVSINGAVTHAYLATIAYLSDAERFAAEDFTIEVVEGLQPLGIARICAAHSPYTNERVPHLAIVISLDRLDPDHPDASPPTISAGCPTCAAEYSAGIVTVRWDEVLQAWTILCPPHCENCVNMAVSADVSRWVNQCEHSHADRFMLALVDTLDAEARSWDRRFQEFCLRVHAVMTIEQAATYWRLGSRSIQKGAAAVRRRSSD